MQLTETKKKEALDQYMKEKTAAMKQRQRFATSWIKNEQLYNGTPTTTLITRSNLHVPKVFEAVSTASARMGRMPELQFDTKPEKDENASTIMKHNWLYDARRSRLDEIFRLSKVECGLYSRAIIQMIPGNDGNRFELVDTLSFLISPIANTIRTARNLGKQFIYKTMTEIEMEADDMEYDKGEIKIMKDEKVANDKTVRNSNNEDQSLRNLRLAYLGLQDTQNLGIDVVELTEWYTWIGNEQVVMTVADDKYILRIITLKEARLPRWPFSSYALYPRGVAFWVPSVADIHRDPNLATDVTVNQMIDNNTYRNFGMLFVDSSSGLKQSSITPRPLGVTPVNTAGGKIRDKVWQFIPPEITQSINTAQFINGIADNASGLSSIPAGSRGKSSVTEIATNNAIVEEKNNDFKENINIMFEDLGQLYADTLKMNLTTPRNVKIYDREEITLEGVTKENFKDVEFIVVAETAENAVEAKALQQKAAESLFMQLKNDPLVPNQPYLRENLMKKYGLNEEQIGKLMKKPESDATQMVNQTDPNAIPVANANIPTGNVANPVGAELSKTGSLAQSVTQA